MYEDKFIVSSNKQIFFLDLTSEPKTWNRMNADGSVKHLIGSKDYAMTLEESTGKVWMYAGTDATGEAMQWVNWILTSNWTYVSPIILAGLPPLSRSKSAFVSY